MKGLWSITFAEISTLMLTGVQYVYVEILYVYAYSFREFLENNRVVSSVTQQ